MSDADAYKLRWRGRETGPFSAEEINRRLDEHEIGMGHEIFYQHGWITVEEFLAALEASSAPPSPPVEEPSPLPPPIEQEMAPVRAPPIRVRITRGDAPDAPASPPRPRKRMMFAFLAVVAGYAGAHNFYTRQWLTGFLQLFLSVATYLMGFGIIASWLWAMAEAVFVRYDGDGIEMT